MKKINFIRVIFCLLFIGCRIISQGQINPQKQYSIEDSSRPNIITVNSNLPDELNYDAGTVRFLASSNDTKGAFSVFELIEMTGYKTAWHRHPQWDEAFLWWKAY